MNLLSVVIPIFLLFTAVVNAKEQKKEAEKIDGDDYYDLSYYDSESTTIKSSKENKSQEDHVEEKSKEKGDDDRELSKEENNKSKEHKSQESKEHDKEDDTNHEKQEQKEKGTVPAKKSKTLIDWSFPYPSRSFEEYIRRGMVS